MPLAHVALAVEGCGWTHPDYFGLMVANMVSCVSMLFKNSLFNKCQKKHAQSHTAGLTISYKLLA